MQGYIQTYSFLALNARTFDSSEFTAKETIINARSKVLESQDVVTVEIGQAPSAICCPGDSKRFSTYAPHTQVRAHKHTYHTHAHTSLKHTHTHTHTHTNTPQTTHTTNTHTHTEKKIRKTTNTKLTHLSCCRPEGRQVAAAASACVV